MSTKKHMIHTSVALIRCICLWWSRKPHIHSKLEIRSVNWKHHKDRRVGARGADENVSQEDFLEKSNVVILKELHHGLFPGIVELVLSGGSWRCAIGGRSGREDATDNHLQIHYWHSLMLPCKTSLWTHNRRSQRNPQHCPTRETIRSWHVCTFNTQKGSMPSYNCPTQIRSLVIFIIPLSLLFEIR